MNIFSEFDHWFQCPPGMETSTGATETKVTCTGTHGNLALNYASIDLLPPCLGECDSCQQSIKLPFIRTWNASEKIDKTDGSR